MSVLKNLILFVIVAQFVVLVSSNQPEFSLPSKCDNVCGFSNIVDSNPYPREPIPGNVDLNGECVSAKNSSIVKWSKFSSKFMQFIGLNETAFECARSKIVFPTNSSVAKRLNFFDISYHTFGSDYQLLRSYEDLYINEPGKVSGHCTMGINRGVMRRQSNGSITTDWLPSMTIASGNPPMTRGTLFPVVNEMTVRRPRSIRVPVGSNDSCTGETCGAFKILWLPASTFNTSVPYRRDSAVGYYIENGQLTEKYSMFVRWNLEEVPGMNELIAKMASGVEELENVKRGLTASNLAIICLPMVLAIIPISLLEEVSTATTLWYVIVTDILVAVPLLIRGIELTVIYPKATPSMSSTLSMMGKRYGIFERWDTRCYPPSGRVQLLGKVLITVAVLVMVLSSLAEFIFWRAGLRNRKDDFEVTERLVSEQVNVDESSLT